MAYSNVLITGATGFLGSRLAERLALGTDYSVTAVVHRLSGPGLARLARIPVKLVLADVLDLESIVTAAENCDIIVHLAYGAAALAICLPTITPSAVLPLIATFVLWPSFRSASRYARHIALLRDSVPGFDLTPVPSIFQ